MMTQTEREYFWKARKNAENVGYEIFCILGAGVSITFAFALSAFAHMMSLSCKKAAGDMLAIPNRERNACKIDLLYRKS